MNKITSLLSKSVAFRLFTFSLILLFVSCSKNEYLNVIPKNASLVVSVDAKSVFEKADLANSSKLQAFAKGQVGQYLNNPESTGVDFRQPVYIFSTADGNLGATFCVNDIDKVRDFIQNIAGMPTETDGIYSLYQAGIYYGFNKSTLLLMTSRVVGEQLFTLSDQERFTDSDSFRNLSKNSKDVNIYCSLSALNQTVPDVVLSMLPKNIRPSDVDYFGGISFENGRALWNQQLKGRTREVQKTLDKGNKTFKKIDGEFVDNPMENFSAWACIGIKKGELLPILKSNKDINTLLLGLGRGIDIDMIVREVEGDVAIVFPSFPSNDSYSQPNMMIMGELDDDDFLKDVDYWTESMKDYGMSMSRTSGQNYVLKAGDFTLNWGVDDDIVYFATPEMFAQNVIAPRSNLLAPLKNDIEDCIGYVYVNFENLQLSGGVDVFTSLLLSAIKSIEFRVESITSCSIIVNSKDDSQNILKSLLL